MVLKKMWASPQWKFSSDPSVKKKSKAVQDYEK